MREPHVYQAGSIFSGAPVDVRAFSSTFVFEMPFSTADGFTFTIQGSSSHALGGSGMGLGCGPDAASPFDRGAKITKSVTVEFGLIDHTTLQPRSTLGLYLDGATPQSVGDHALRVDLHAKNATFTVSLQWAGGVLEFSIKNLESGQSDAVTFAVDIPSHAGREAYVGFTGATGGLTSTQNILSWEFSPLVAWPSECVKSATRKKRFKQSRGGSWAFDSDSCFQTIPAEEQSVISRPAQAATREHGRMRFESEPANLIGSGTSLTEGS